MVEKEREMSKVELKGARVILRYDFKDFTIILFEQADMMQSHPYQLVVANHEKYIDEAMTSYTTRIEANQAFSRHINDYVARRLSEGVDPKAFRMIKGAEMH